MKNILYLSILFSSLFAVVHRVPHDRETIQEGITNAEPGDTVLVDDGTYYENIIINKEITVASYFLMDGDLSHRDVTIIDGSNYNEDYGPFGSCVLFRPSDTGEAISAKLIGFTIQNGQGTKVRETTAEGDIYYRMGGGLMIDHCLPEITYNYIRDNGGETTDRGGRTGRGGGGAFNNDDDVEFDEDRNRDYPRTKLPRDDEIIFSNNIFENNDSETGKTLETLGFEGEIDFSYSVFDVFASEYEDVSEYWVVKNNASTDYFEAEGALEAITDVVWVSPVGLDSAVSTGIIDSPFKTIDHAFSRIYATSNNPIEIKLTEGTFSPSETGEIFQITMISNVYIRGQGEELTIIDAEGSDRVFMFEGCSNNIISNLTVTGGYKVCNLQMGWGYCNGGGLFIRSSNLTITNVTIRNNEATWGAGIMLGSSNVILTNVTIRNNVGQYGGGLCQGGSTLIALNVTISDNSVYIGGWNNETEGNGGGMYIKSPGDNTVFKNVTISNNWAENEAGAIFMRYDDIDYTNVIIWGNNSLVVAPGLTENFGISGSASPNFTYSDIEGGWDDNDDENFNIDLDPQFVDPENGDFTLQPNSPCIDSGEYDIWNLDSDGTTADMGATGGSSILPNFTEYDFGEVGDIILRIDFMLYNFGDSDITIESVSFSTDHFTTPTDFPIVIPPILPGIITINCLPDSLGQLDDNMIINSPDQLIDGLSVALTGIGSTGNLLGGELSGTLESLEYRITNHISVEHGDILIINPGTKFLFDGGYDFSVNGVLKAQGTESDSIIFDNFGEERMAQSSAGDKEDYPSTYIDYDPSDYPDMTRQGGDTMDDATVVDGLPYNDTGTTAGYTDNYDETCPYTGSTSPDVVYSFTSDADVIMSVDLCSDGNSYDTKTYVYENQVGNLASTLADGANSACNDDFCSNSYTSWASFIGDVVVTAGNTYYIVIDGYGGNYGNYDLMLADATPAPPPCNEVERIYVKSSNK